MKDFKDTMLENIYYKVRDNKIPEPMMFKTIEMYIKAPMTEKQKRVIREYVYKIQNYEMTLDEFLALYEYKVKVYEANH